MLTLAGTLNENFIYIFSYSWWLIFTGWAERSAQDKVFLSDIRTKMPFRFTTFFSPIPRNARYERNMGANTDASGGGSVSIHRRGGGRVVRLQWVCFGHCLRWQCCDSTFCGTPGESLPDHVHFCKASERGNTLIYLCVLVNKMSKVY